MRVLTTDPPCPEDSSSLLSLADLVPYIDWSPFFHTWELRGRYPEILANLEAEEVARRRPETTRDDSGEALAGGSRGLRPVPRERPGR